MSVTAEALLRSALSDLEDTAEAFGYLAAVFEAIVKNRVAEDVDLAGAGSRLAWHLHEHFQTRHVELFDAARPVGVFKPGGADRGQD